VLWQDGTQVPLTPRVFDILATLVERHGELVTKDDFMRVVWGGVAVEDNNLARQISTLRKLLHERPGQREYIATVTGVGYRFVGTVTELDELPEDLLPLVAHHPADAPQGEVISAIAVASPAVEPEVTRAAEPAPSLTAAAPAAVATGARDDRRGSPDVRQRRYLLVTLAAMAAVLVLAVLWPDRPTIAAPVSRALWQFTHDSGSQSEPAWSPDGTRLALTSDRNGNADIWVLGVNDSSAIQLTTSNAHDWQPNWSPDGQSLVYRSERAGGGLYLVPASGGPERHLTTFGSNPLWSPTGNVILFTHTAPDSTRAVKLFVINASGGTPRRVQHPALAGTQITNAAWAPDGRVSVWTRDEVGGRQFVTVPIDGGTATRSALPDDIAAPAPGSAAPTLGAFAWAPSRRFLYFEGRSQSVVNLWRVPVDPQTLNWTGGPERLTLGPGADKGISLSPDGSRLAFAINTAKPGIWSFGFDPATGVIAADGQRVISGTSGERGADATSDGSRVVYRLVRSDRQEVWSRAFDAAPELLVSERGWNVSAPRWSPDNTRLAYQRSPNSLTPASAPRSVAVLDVGSGDRTPRPLLTLAPGQEAVPTDWSADGRTILTACRLAEGEPIGTCALSASGAGAGTNDWALTRLAGDARVALFQQRYSPNQRWISFVAVPRADRSTTTVYVMPASGGPWRPVTDGQSYEDKSRWSPDGRVLYFISNRDGRFEVWGRRFDPEAGRPEGQPFRVTSLEGTKQILSPYLTDMEMFITPTRIFLPMFEASSRIWVLDQADR
jgi:Tol biopolymer transport system component/DNA-binding winged helix-turn-helix (wHTH) protein